MTTISTTQSSLLFVAGGIITYIGFVYSKDHTNDPFYKKYGILAFGVILCLAAIGFVIATYTMPPTTTVLASDCSGCENKLADCTTKSKLDVPSAATNIIASGKPFYIRAFDGLCLSDSGNSTKYDNKECDGTDPTQVFKADENSQIVNTKTQQCMSGALGSLKPSLCQKGDDQIYTRYSDDSLHDKNGNCPVKVAPGPNGKTYKNVCPSRSDYKSIFQIVDSGMKLPY